MSHLGLPDQCDTADNMEVSSTERLTSDVPVINEYNKTYTPRMARQAAEPMAHSGQNNINEVSESRGIWASAQPQHQVSDSVLAMCNMVLMIHDALMTSKINMQARSEELSEGEDFGYPSDIEW